MVSQYDMNRLYLYFVYTKYHQSLFQYHIFLLRKMLTYSKHFQYLNRYDFIINTGGIKVNPEEIELKLKSLLKKPFFIWFMKDVHLGQKIVLVVQEKVNLKLKKKDFTHYLNKYEIPKNYCQIKDFVLSKSQKIDRIKTMQTIDFKQWKIIE